MIWFLLVLLVALALFIVLPPLFRDAKIGAEDSLLREIEASKTQLQQIKDEIESGYHDEDSAARAKRAMEKRILKLADRLEKLQDDKASGGLPLWIKVTVPAFIGLGSVLLYPLVGAPNYSRQANTPQPVLAETQRSLPELIEQMKATLAAQPQPDPTGYVLLARAQMSLRAFDDAMASYQVALEASDNEPAILAEFENAKTAIEQANAQISSAPNLSQEQVSAFNEMTPEERQATILSMVDGLANRLADDPSDLNGWLRLIRARVVLGDSRQAQTDLTSAQSHFAEDSDALGALNELQAELGLQ